MNLNFCPMCGVNWNGWGEKIEPVKCWSCGFDSDSITRMSEPNKEPITESCPDHPKYKAIGKPATDCPTCWRMYQYAIYKQAKEVFNGNK